MRMKTLLGTILSNCQAQILEKRSFSQLKINLGLIKISELNLVDNFRLTKCLES